MKRLVLIAVLLASGCYAEGQGKGEPAKGVETVTINYDMTNEQRVQQAVDNGGQLWRNDPRDVAHAALINQSVDARLEDCSIAEQGERLCVVSVKSKDGDFRVRTERLVRPDGIWTATRVEVIELRDKYKDAASFAEGHDHSGHGH